MAQIFTNSGLTAIFHQLSIGATPSSTPATYYVGLFSGGTGTTIPNATATLSSFGGSFTEMVGSGYSRQEVNFNSPTLAIAYDAPSPVLETTLDGDASANSWFVNLNSVAGLLAGMTIVIGTEDPKTIAAINGSEVILTSPLSSLQSDGSMVVAGDSVSGERSIGATVTFLSTGTWEPANGYFITNSASGNSGNIYYFSNFADQTSPTLGANDTLQVTPTWLLSN